MNTTDEKVLAIFNCILYNKSNYYSHKEKHGGLVFNVNGTEILLRWFRKDDKDKLTNEPISIEHFKYDLLTPWSVCMPSGTGYRFYITVGEHGRQLVVPELTRTEEARALDRIEFLANDKEQKELDLMLSILNPSLIP